MEDEWCKWELVDLQVRDYHLTLKFLKRNHSTQSYLLQVQWMMEVVFARLGVRHEATHFGNGGLAMAVWREQVAEGCRGSALLDDPNYTDGEEKDVEVAIQMRGKM
eukprot:scaffold1727_cov133-Cylindrotheca_fusiformis.AAC.46